MNVLSAIVVFVLGCGVGAITTIVIACGVVSGMNDEERDYD